MVMDNKIRFWSVCIYICCIFGTSYNTFSNEDDTVVSTGNICIGDISSDGDFEVQHILDPVTIERSDSPDKVLNKILVSLRKYMQEIEADSNGLCVYLYKIGDDLVEDLYKNHCVLEKSKIINVDFCFVLAKCCQNKIVLKYNMREFEQWQKDKMLSMEDYFLKGYYGKESSHKTFSYLHKQIIDHIRLYIPQASDIKEDDINIYINSVEEENKVNDSHKYITGEDEIIVYFSDELVRRICKDDFLFRFF